MNFLPVITPEGTVWVSEDELTPEERSLAASHRNVVTSSLGLGVSISDYEGKTIGGLHLATDIGDLEQLEEDGHLDFDDFYWDGTTW